MGSGNPVGFGMTLRTSMLDTLSMTSIAIEPLCGMGMRQEVLHGFAVAHFAELAGFLVRQEGRAQEQNEKTDEERLMTAGFWAFRVHLNALIRHSGESRNPDADREDLFRLGPE